MGTREEIEEAIRPYLGKGEIEKTLNDGFEYACLEAEHIGLPKKGRDFRHLCRKGLLLAMTSAFAYVTEELPEKLKISLEDMEGMNITIPHPTRGDIKNMIMYQYGSKHWFDYMPEEDFTQRERELFNDMRLRSNKAYGWNDQDE